MSKTADKLAARADPAERPPSLNELIENQLPEIRKALPQAVSPERFARVATTAIKSSPDLLRCSPASLLGALMVASQTGLEPGPIGLSYIVPRKIKGHWEAQWQIGYKGICELARRSGEIADIHAREVRVADEFEFEYGLEDRLVHRPALEDRGEIVAVYGLAKYLNGGHYFLVMSVTEVEERRQRSSAPNSPAWQKDYAAMARKTVLRAMAPWLPLKQEAASALAHDEQVHTTLAPNMTDESPDEPPDDVIDVEEVHEGATALDELVAVAATAAQQEAALVAAQAAAEAAGVDVPEAFDEITEALAAAALEAL